MQKIALALIAVLCLTLPAAVARADGSAAARASLAKRLPEAKLINVPLTEAIDFMRDISGSNIVVDWKAIESVNITRDAMINLDLHQVRLEKLLDLVLQQAGPGNLLTYYVDENVIHITTQVAADQKLITIVYDVEDLISGSDDFDYTISLNVNNGSSGQSGAQGTQGTQGAGTGGLFGGTSSGAGGTGIFGGSGSGTGSGSGSRTSNTATQRADKAKALVKMIATIIRPEVWKDNGGPASIEYYDGRLIVTAPRSVQEAIGGPVN